MKVKFLSNFYTPLFVYALILAAAGLVNLHSATITFQQRGASDFLLNQALYHGLGVLMMFAASRLSSRMLYDLAWPLYATAILLLLLVLFLGAEVHGSLSWLDLGFVRVQPSEFAKLGLIFLLSRHLAGLEARDALGAVGMIKPALIAGLPMALVLLQKDLGSSLFFGLLFVTLVSFHGVRWHLVVGGLLFAVLAGVIAFQFLLMPYQKKRIVSFMNPELDSRGSGYHLVQSKIAVGSGQMWGRGYLKGMSNKLKFLPERHTDFIFPVLAEEWGFAGSVAVVGFYSLFLFHGLGVASRSNNRYGFFLGLGLTALFFWHLVVNLGGVLGLLPLTGVPLPFLSYGGSSLLTNWAAIGVLLALYRGRMGYGRAG